MALPLPLLSGQARSLPLPLLATATFSQKIWIFLPISRGNNSQGSEGIKYPSPVPKVGHNYYHFHSKKWIKRGVKSQSIGLVYRYFTATLSAATWAFRYRYRYFFSKVAPLLKIATFSGSALFLAVATSAALNALELKYQTESVSTHF